MRNAANWHDLAAIGGILLALGSVRAEEDAPDKLDFSVKLEVTHQVLAPESCWFHPRAAAIPGAGQNGRPAVLLTLQQHLKVSDYYSSP